MITTFFFIQLIAFQLAYLAAHYAGTSIFSFGGMLPVENKQSLRVMAALLMTVSIALFIMKLGWMRLRGQLWVAEIVYFPLETELLRNARALGCRTLDGGNMAVFQAVKAFELFSGVAPDAQRMLEHFQSMNH